ncbi:hypothetical protein [Janthinobacterium sp. RB2R34]|uniref:hypothetical protein n=1 Tax=Janthinobacterium sp. RB2R34 TaxID=3424193 RepID=UPI003F23381B
MHTEPPHPSLNQLHQLGLITAEELEQANAERDAAAHERLHPPADPVDMPQLAQDADLVATLGWLLLTDFLPKNDLDKRMATLPPKQQALAAEGVRHYNRREIDDLYELDLLNQFQRDAAHAAAPSERMFYSPWIAMRWLVVNGVLSTAQFEALEVRVRANGSELAREIMEASRLRHGEDRIPYKRPPAWKGALIVLGMIMVGSVIYGVITGTL